MKWKEEEYGLVRQQGDGGIRSGNNEIKNSHCAQAKKSIFGGECLRKERF